MCRSMTGYARVALSLPLGAGILEIHSVNRKGLDMHLHLPRELLYCDVDIRKKLSSKIERGQVTLRLNITAGVPHQASQLKVVKRQWEEVCGELGLDSREITLSFLVDHSHVQLPFNEKEVSLLLMEGIDHALAQCIRMKQEEGALLAQDLLARLQAIGSELAVVETLKGAPEEVFRKKLSEKLAEIGLLDDELKNRVAKEVAILAEKSDITEEIVRLKAHLVQFEKHLSQGLSSIGRVLDFLSQEMLRELNTMGAKSQELKITQHVLAMKAELDRIKEQVQNIE